MGEIKSALEIALEKAEKLGKLSKEELEADKWRNEGKKRAVQFLNEKASSIQEALKDIPPEFIQFALEGASETLLRNVVIPRDSSQELIIKRALKGIAEIKGSIANEIIPQIEYLINNYQQTISNYKAQFQQQVQSSLGGMQQQEMMTEEGLSALASMQEEWNKISSEIMKKFEDQLETLKNYLK